MVRLLRCEDSENVPELLVAQMEAGGDGEETYHGETHTSNLHLLLVIACF